MIDVNTFEIIKKAPVEERTRIVEELLQSLSDDVRNINKKGKYKPFKVRKVSLGKEVHVDRI